MQNYSTWLGIKNKFNVILCIFRRPDLQKDVFKNTKEINTFKILDFFGFFLGLKKYYFIYNKMVYNVND